METARGTQQTALLVIDVQNAVVGDGYDRDGVLERIALSIDKAREQHVPVIYIQHYEIDERSDMQRGSEGWQIHDRVKPLEGEVVIGKTYPDSFAATDLAETLEDLDIDHLAICGAQTDFCVRTTTMGALNRGYDVTLIEDAHTTSDLTLDDGTIIPAKQTIAHFNATTPWIGFPDRTIRATTAADLVFAAPVISR
jgi:nicotinamidase-related amidase